MDIPGLPNIPTDNYHKFKALAGVWIVVGCYALNWVGIFYVQREWFDVQTHAASVKADARALNEDLADDKERMALVAADRIEMRAAIDTARREIDRIRVDKTPTARELEIADARVRQLREGLNSITSRMDANQRQVEEHRAKSRQILKDYALILIAGKRAEILAREFAGLMIFMFLQSLFGMWLAQDGFRGWRKLQALEESGRNQKRSAVEVS